MPYIHLRPDLFGITSLLDFRKETAEPLCRLTHLLLRGDSSMTFAEREMIAAYVSSRNACVFCSSAHTAATCSFPGGKESGIQPMITDTESLHITTKMKSLLNLAGKVQQNGNQVTQEDVELAKESGATDMEIHDTVLIAALFCLYNRYVDGLAATTPGDEAYYESLGSRLHARGYLMPEDGYKPLTY
jgi:uncharacterized peroxidase-related enzyme